MIIDRPQAVDAAGNHHAELMLKRDVANLGAFFVRFAPELRVVDDACSEEKARLVRMQTTA